MKGAFDGTGKVFKFTAKQLLKNKANIFSLIFMMLVALLSFPIISMFDTQEMPQNTYTDNTDFSNVKRIYYIDQTELALTPELLTHFGFDGIEKINKADFELNRFDEATESGSMLLVFSPSEEGSIPSCMIYFNGVQNSNDLLSAVQPRISQYLYTEYLLRSGADANSITKLTKPIRSNVYYESDYLDSGQEESMMANFTIQYLYSIVLMLLTLLTSAYIIKSVIEEKSSKVVETLMVSVRPLATVAGKVLAVMAYAFIMTLGIAAAFVCSYFIAGKGESSSIDQLLTGFFSSLNLTPFTAFAALVSLILAFFTFAAISAITGAGCSSSDDIESASMSVVLPFITLYIISSIVTPIVGGTFASVYALIPFISAFCALPMYVMGVITLPVLIASWIIQALLDLALIYFGASVYRYLIVYNGSKLKFIDIIRTFKRKGVNAK